MGTSNPYASNKAILHMDRLLAIRAGEQPPPVHLHFIISDLCNQDCPWCLTEDAIIDTIQGPKGIADIRVGDYVWGPDGKPQRVQEISKREAEQTIVIEAGGRIIEGSAEHPVLTSEGWKAAGLVRVGDSAVVRVRVRESGTASARVLEPLSPISSAEAWNVSGRSRTSSREYAAKQPDETARSEGKGIGQNKRATASALSAGHAEYRRGRTTPDAFGSQSDEGPEAIPSGDVQVLVAPPIEERAAVGGVVPHEWSSIDARGRRELVDRPAQPGFSHHRSEEGGRANAEGMLHRREKDARLDELWGPHDRALSTETLGMPGPVREGQGSVQASYGGCHSRLCVAGIALERGLELRQVDRVVKMARRRTVYNFSCLPGQAYEANGIVVHNCAYRMENYTEHFAVIEADGTRNHNPNRMIPYEKAIEIIEDFKTLGGKAVQFTGGGEPTVHPRCGEIMTAAQELNLETALVTNAVRLDKVLDPLMKSVWVRISVDASRPDTYMATRRVPAGHWEKMLGNVDKLVRKRDAEGSPLTIGIGFVVHKDNWREVADCARMAKGLGVDNLRISALFQPDDAAYFDGFHAEAAALCQEAESINGGRFRVINNFGTRVADLEQQSPDYKRCGYMNFTTYIGADLNLYRCCVLSYTDRGTVGSLKDKRLIDLWNSPEKRNDFGKFDARSCPRCQFNDKNRDINRIIEELPVMHGNFV